MFFTENLKKLLNMLCVFLECKYFMTPLSSKFQLLSALFDSSFMFCVNFIKSQ